MVGKSARAEETATPPQLPKDPSGRRRRSTDVRAWVSLDGAQGALIRPGMGQGLRTYLSFAAVPCRWPLLVVTTWRGSYACPGAVRLNSDGTIKVGACALPKYLPSCD